MGDRGEGSVYQRKDGRWVAVLRVPAPDGTARRLECAGPTRAAAIAARRARRLVEADRARRAVTPTLAEWLATWAQTQAPRWAAATQQRHGMAIRLYIAPTLGPIPLGDLTPAHIEAWQATLRTERGGPSCLNAWRVLRTALHAAERAGLVSRNVAALSTRPPAAPPRETCLSAVEARRVLATAYGTRWYAILAVAVYTGLREGELLGLQWGALDLHAGLLSVRAQLTGRSRATWALTPPKTRAGVRTLPLPGPLLGALWVWHHTQAATRTAAGAAWQPVIPDLVWTTRHGTPLSARNLVRAWHALSVRAGVPDLPFHSLRHTAATLLLDAGLAQAVVLAWFGWQSSTMLNTVYSHPRASDLVGVSRALARRLADLPLADEAGTGEKPRD